MENSQAEELYLYIAEKLRQYNLVEFHNIAYSRSTSDRNENTNRFLLKYVQQLIICFELHSPEMVDKILADLNRDVTCYSGDKIEAILIEQANIQNTISVGDINMKQLVNFGPLHQYFEALEETISNDLGLRNDKGIKPR